MNLKKCILIYPPTGLYDRWDRCQAPVKKEVVEIIRPPVDLAYIAAVLEHHGTKCMIRDYPAEGQSWEDLDADLESYNPNAVIVSAVTPTFAQDCLVFDMARKKNSKVLTIAKGVISDDQCRSALQKHENLDIIVRDEAALSIGEIFKGSPLEDIKGITWKKYQKIHINPARPHCTDLDILPFPARHLLKNDLYRMPDTGRKMGLILTGVGCPYACVYCLVGKTFGKKVHLRKPQKIVAEIEECFNLYGISDFWFRADTFTFRKQWVIELCQEIVSKGLKINWTTNSRVDTLDEEMLGWIKRAGCFGLGFGIESGSQAMIDKMKKGITLQQARQAVALCKKHKILTYLFFIIGLPWENENTVKETIAFAKELNGDLTNFTIACPFPGTDLHNIFIENGLLSSDEKMEGFDYANPASGTLYLSKAEVLKWHKRASRAVLIQPSYILRTLLRIRSFTMLLNYSRAGMRMLKRIL